MLNKLDDYPIHQTPEPIAHPATSDRNVYDRTWFNGYAKDGSYYFGIGMAIYPHRGILDCAFSVVTRDGRQHCFYGSRRAPTERTEMQVGPFRIEIQEPMLRTRVVLDDNESGISCDLSFSGRTAVIKEARQTLYSGPRAVMDATRFDQFGRWSGTVRHPDGEIAVDDGMCLGTKDRSWGVRRVGEPETGGAPAMPGGIFFLWAPLVWDDHVSHAIFFDGPKGEALVREGLTAPLYASEADVPGVEDGKDERMATAKHRVSYVPGTRLAKSAEIDLVDLEGGTRTISLEPILKFQMKGLGYTHPEWGQGMWKGELATGHESFDPKQLDPLAMENLHVQQVVRASDGTREGMGVLEQICIGPYAPAGFTDFFDGAK
ncbi:hypothetical protein FHS78_000975 [Parvibaculum indicum]|uniref:hypothetical protein n=1 Tax=Parvibaculum indicum TaxID=562969 RepID=UPI001421F3F2|nr:hypothetical protein [Parvibaculum indicum]NIJ40699.1 hypothetical protein [Parvibaculum indicum]